MDQLAKSLSAQRKRVIVDAIGRGASISEALRLAFPEGTGSRPGYVTFWRWRENDKRFATELYEAECRYLDTLRDELYRRAVTGWDEKVYQRGELAGTVRKYDSALLALLARRLPELKDRKQIDVAVSGGAMISPADLEVLSDVERDQAIVLLERIRQNRITASAEDHLGGVKFPRPQSEPLQVEYVEESEEPEI